MKLGGGVQYPSLTKCCYFSRMLEIQYGRHGSHLGKPITNLNSSSTAGISNETWWGCSVPNPGQVLLFFKDVGNPIWPPSSPLEKPITNLNSRTTEGISMKLGGGLQYPTLTKCCYFSRTSEIQYGRQVAVFFSQVTVKAHVPLVFE